MEKETIQVVETEAGVTIKKQKVSASYTIRAFGENIKKFRELGLIEAEQERVLTTIHKKVAETYMKKELGL